MARDKIREAQIVAGPLWRDATITQRIDALKAAGFVSNYSRVAHTEWPNLTLSQRRSIVNVLASHDWSILGHRGGPVYMR